MVQSFSAASRVGRIIDQVTIYFLQEKDGIRDIGVTGVQTCALPISLASGDLLVPLRHHVLQHGADLAVAQALSGTGLTRAVVALAHGRQDQAERRQRARLPRFCGVLQGGVEPFSNHVASLPTAARKAPRSKPKRPPRANRPGSRALDPAPHDGTNRRPWRSE